MSRPDDAAHFAVAANRPDRTEQARRLSALRRERVRLWPGILRERGRWEQHRTLWRAQEGIESDV